MTLFLTTLIWVIALTAVAIALAVVIKKVFLVKLVNPGKALEVLFLIFIIIGGPLLGTVFGIYKGTQKTIRNLSDKASDKVVVVASGLFNTEASFDKILHLTEIEEILQSTVNTVNTAANSTIDTLNGYLAPAFELEKNIIDMYNSLPIPGFLQNMLKKPISQITDNETYKLYSAVKTICSNSGDIKVQDINGVDKVYADYEKSKTIIDKYKSYNVGTLIHILFEKITQLILKWWRMTYITFAYKPILVYVIILVSPLIGMLVISSKNKEKTATSQS